MKDANIDVKKLGTEEVNNMSFKNNYDVDEYTFDDIIDSFKKPHRDPRDELAKPLLKSDITHIEDLHVGDKLQGTVRNVVDFGAFVDIGIKSDGLIHISKITKDYIKHPSEVLSVGDIVDVYVEKIDLEKGKVSLTMLED